MIKIYDKSGAAFLKIIKDAYNVCVHSAINDDITLTFDAPAEQIKDIPPLSLCLLDGQYYRIAEINYRDDGARVANVSAMHIYHDNEWFVVRRIDNQMGVNPQTIFNQVFAATPLRVLSEAEITALGMAPLTRLIDFWEASKITPDDAVKTIIQSAGYGELYIDNYNIALVERLGAAEAVSIVSTSNNAQTVSQSETATDLITRLIPYGKSDMPINSVNPTGLDYIDSPNIGLYGIHEKIKVYGNIDNVDMLFARASFEFSPDNPERLDAPHYTLEGRVVDIVDSPVELNLGDPVRVLDKQSGIDQIERIIKIDIYPYDYTNSVLTIGHIPRDLFFYLKSNKNELANINNLLNNLDFNDGSPGEQITIDKCVALVSAPPGDRFSSYEISGELPVFSAAYDVIPGSPIVGYEFGERPDVFYIQGYPTTNKKGALVCLNLFRQTKTPSITNNATLWARLGGSLASRIDLQLAAGGAVSVWISDYSAAPNGTQTISLTDGIDTRIVSETKPIAAYGLLAGSVGAMTVRADYGAGGITGGACVNGYYSSGTAVLRCPAALLIAYQDGTFALRRVGSNSAQITVATTLPEVEYALNATRKTLGCAYTVASEWR